MAITITSPVTGAAQTGFVTPTYTLVADTPPASNAKQWAVTAVGGTQTGVDVHSVSKPFTIAVFRPAQLKPLPQANVPTGIIKNVPSNTYKVITRKGASVAANQAPVIDRISTIIDVFAGTDSFEPTDVQAMIALHIGALSQVSAGIGDTALSGVL